MPPPLDPPPVTFALDGDGVGWITFDAPGTQANVFNAATQAAFSAALDAADRSAARALVIIGAKDRIFIAGADLHALRQLGDPGAAEAFSQHGQELFDRVARFRGPVVTAIHGVCAGGGFELALASQWRLASDAVVTRIGLPETSIGTIPGWGGCVRLPRLIGAEAALEHILRGQLLEPAEALQRGLVDELAPAAELRTRAKTAALRLVADGRPVRRVLEPAPAGVFRNLRLTTEQKTRGHLPAPIAAIDAVEASQALGEPEAFAAEARAFGRVTAGAECKNLIHVFFLREAARKRTLHGWFPQPDAGGAPIRRVGVVGAGVMGSGIAHWLASCGYDVVLRDVQVEFIERALGVIQALLDDGVRRCRATPEDARAVFGRIRTTTSWGGFADCDLVIEAIVENVDAKRALFAELAAIVRPDALLASNSSALPIQDTAGHIAHPERTLGIHFFNPVSRMSLVELILGPATSGAAAGRALALVRTLGKSPVICRAVPGFVVTRVLFFYLNAAIRWWEQGIDAKVIDAAMVEFGWPMGPLRLVDEVGIDVTAFIFGELARYFPARFAPTTACRILSGGGLQGRKNGAARGFYRYSGGGHAESNEPEARAVTAAASGANREPVPAGLVVGAQQLIDALMAVMTDEARRCLSERVVLTPEDIDFALLSGAGFPAYRGGLLRWADRHLLQTE